MINIFSTITRYTSIVFICIYVVLAFRSMGNIGKEKKRQVFYWETAIISYIYLMYVMTSYLKTGSVRVLVLGVVTYLFLSAIVAAYAKIYPKSNKFLLTNIWLMLSVSSIILMRISYTKALRQFVIGALTMVVTLFVPYLMIKIKRFRDYRYYCYYYAVFGIVMLGLVLIMGSVTHGAKLSVNLGFVSIQSSELIKITYPVFIAGILHKSVSRKSLMITILLAGIHILELVLSKDLGSALIFSMTVLFLIYVATGKKELLLGGLLMGCVAAGAAYKLFAHVQVRVAAWLDPWSIIENKGYQIAQSIFAIGTGSFFGMGIYDGNPSYIPVVEQDFIFSAISEEMGGFFAIAIILLCFHTFVQMVSIAFKCQDCFYKLTCFGMAVIYGFQVFLTIGGAIRLIPSTGVTLPLISYGGNSLVSTLVMFSIIQGFNIYGSEEK